MSLPGVTRTVYCCIKLTAEQMAGFSQFKVSSVIGTPQDQHVFMYVDTTNVATATSTSTIGTVDNIPSYTNFIIFMCYIRLGTSSEVANYGEMLIELF